MYIHKNFRGHALGIVIITSLAIMMSANEVTANPNIVSVLPSTENVYNQVGEERTFMIVMDQAVNVSWRINGTEVTKETNVAASTYINDSAATGIWNVTAIVSSNTGTDTHKWDWTVGNPPVVRIEIKNFEFIPPLITIANGTTVIWTNNDSFAHTVTSDTGIFDSGILSQRQTFEFTFNEIGIFKYYCSLHPFMQGEVDVESEPGLTPPPIDGTGIGLQLVADNFTAPVALVSPEDGTGRLFIVDQIGVIKIVTADGNILSEPFMDISSKIVSLNPQYDERGLIGLAFHPNFSQNGRFFVYYSAPLRPEAPAGWDHTSKISEFNVLENDLNKSNLSSERVLLQVDEPQSNHNGGKIAFGPDGYLYIPLGDGGEANDVGIGHPQPGNGQNISTLLGKVLRIDVNNETPYGIPPDNPFVGKEGLKEIFAYGFRNPFHISFDAGGNHSLFTSDAGQNAWEEVDIVTKGSNYGWNIKEGTHCFDPNNPNLSNLSCPDADADGQPLIDPAIEYANAVQPGGIGVVVVGGYIYRGNALPQFTGNYVFGDFSKGFIVGNGSLFIARPPSAGEKMWSIKELQIATSSTGRIDEFVRSFGQDDDHELYVLTSQMLGPKDNTGKIYKIKRFMGYETVGIYRNGSFFLRNSNSAGSADLSFVYGIDGDTPLVGDWDSDGFDTVGIYRNGAFYLRNSNDAGNANLSFIYGIDGDTPLVGDWDSDGVDTVGIYRNGSYYLRNSNSAGSSDLSFVYGIDGDTPLVGDWDGDGTDTVGIYRNGAYYLRNSNGAGNADLSFVYGMDGDTPLVGDWNGDGVDTIGIYRNGAYYLRNSNSAGNADLSFVYGIDGDTPITGDWDGQ